MNLCKIALTALLIALALPASASAADGERIARAYFPNACGPVEVVQSETPHPSSPNAIAWAESPLLGFTDCRVTLAPTFSSYSYAVRCTAMIHEYGHLAGLGHSEDPADVMYPTVETIAPACAQARRKISVRVR